MENQGDRLSAEAFSELKEIVDEEYGPGHSDAEIEEMGHRVLDLFRLFILNRRLKR